MAEFKYAFKAVNDQNQISGSKILNIIDGFPSDYSEQTVLIYGKLKTLFSKRRRQIMTISDIIWMALAGYKRE